MIKYILSLLIVLFFLSTINSQKISLLTYNLRLDLASDGENAWPNRKDFLVSQLNFYTPDIFGTQEGLPHQIDYINKSLTEYDFIGNGRDGGHKGEYSAIFFNKKLFKVENQNTFWLSPTPTIVSKGWDAAYRRICTYGLFTKINTNEKFWVFNTHLDNKGENARKNAIKLILKKIQEKKLDNFPVILMGDLNALPNSDLIKELKVKMYDSKDVSSTPSFGPEGTFNGFEIDKPVTKRIDYILLIKSKIIKVQKYAVLIDSKNLKYPSDHMPVYIEFTINTN